MCGQKTFSVCRLSQSCQTSSGLNSSPYPLGRNTEQQQELGSRENHSRSLRKQRIPVRSSFLWEQFIHTYKGGHFTYPKMLCAKLYYQSFVITWSYHFNMDVLDEQAWQAPVFSKSNLLYVYCVDLEHVSELMIPSLPFLKLKCSFGHVSFPRTLSERRMVVFPQSNRVLDKLKDVTSPCVIKIISSVIFQVMML